MAIVAIAMAGSVAFAGCGTARPAAVASVQGSPISRAALEHWMRIENAQIEGASASVPVPDPPRYVSCVAGARALRERLQRPALSSRALRRRCAQVYAQLKQKALVFLITARWIEGEASAQGVRASPSEAQATYERLLNGPAGATFAANLRHAGMDRSDELLRLRLERLAAGLRIKAGAGRRLDAFLAAYRRRWRLRTSCLPGYVVPECRNGPPFSPASDRRR